MWCNSKKMKQLHSPRSSANNNNNKRRAARKFCPSLVTRLLVLTFCVGLLPLLFQLSLYSSLSSTSTSSLSSSLVHADVNDHSAFTFPITPSDWDVRVVVRPGNTTATSISAAISAATAISTATAPIKNGMPRVHDEHTNTTNNKNKNHNLLQGLPDWIRNYIHWHQQQRLTFPGNLLFTDPAAPKLLIRTCYTLCGGLHDRLGKLPWDLYLANQTGRLLLMHWCRTSPAPLPDFLLPNLLDWRVPAEQDIYHNATTCGSTEKVVTDLFDKQMHANRPRADFWTTHLDAALERATTGAYKNIRVLRHRVLGDEQELGKRLTALGEKDVIDWTPSYGKIFWIFFRPSPAVQMELDSVFTDLDLQPGQYSAVHCRVRHPKALSKEFSKGKTSLPGGADRVGLLWEGASRDFAVGTAVHALQCGQTLLLPSPTSPKSPLSSSSPKSQSQSQSKHENSREPIYFYSDSEDLARYISSELNDPVFLRANASSSLIETIPVHRAARQVVQQSRIVGRRSSTENLHIDRQGGHEAAAYYGSFVDLLVAAQSRCVTYGVGNYAIFASKISGSECRLQHQRESWGPVDDRKTQHTAFCALNSTNLFEA